MIPQRLAVLRRLRARYPDDAILRIEIARALQDDHAYEQAFQECVAVIEEDPGNRMAVSELVHVSTREERKLPYIKAALAADPLNFRAREFLFRHEGDDDEFRSAHLSARRALQTAPFSLRIAEGYVEALLNRQLHEQASEHRPFDPRPARICLTAIENANHLRKIIELAARMLVTRLRRP